MIPGQELESDDIAVARVNTVRSKGQRSVLGNLDGDIGGQRASGEAQESRNDGGEMHFSDKAIKAASYNRGQSVFRGALGR